MNTSKNRIVNFNSSINLAKEHEKNLKNEALNMQLKIMGQNLNLNERASDLTNLKSLIKRNQTIIDGRNIIYYIIHIIICLFNLCHIFLYYKII